MNRACYWQVRDMGRTSQGLTSLFDLCHRRMGRWMHSAQLSPASQTSQYVTRSRTSTRKEIETLCHAAFTALNWYSLHIWTPSGCPELLWI